MATSSRAAPPETSDEAAPKDRRMRRLALVLLPAAFFIAIFAVYLFRDARKPVIGSRAPDFTAAYLDQPGEFRLSSLRGKPVLLNFWASWCPPCKEEAPLLEEAYGRYRGEVEFVGIDIRDARDEAVEFVESYGITYPQVRDEVLRIYTQYGLTSQPESFFIDQDGVVVQHVRGPLQENVLYQYLDTLVSRNA